MRLIVGLGNPGAQYAHNRHNVGFMAVDAVARANGFSTWSRRFQGEVAEGRLGDDKVLALKPMTYMNNSGQSVGEALRFYKLDPADVTVLYDELDLAAGKVRIKTGGGAGGHNGIRSLDAHIGKDYRRVRIGIGHPGAKELVHNWVLGNFAKADAEWLEPLLDAIGRAAPDLMTGDGSQFMNRIALAIGAMPERAEQPKPRAQSHIRQARQSTPKALPQTGPMADMLKKLLGTKKDD